MSEDGFNIVHTYSPNHWTTENSMKRYIQLCANNGLQAVVNARTFFKIDDSTVNNGNTIYNGENTYNNSNTPVSFCERAYPNSLRVNLDHYFEKVFMNSPYRDFIWGYYLCDEPSAEHWIQRIQSPIQNYWDGDEFFEPDFVKTEIPPRNIAQAMEYFKNKLARSGLSEKKIILCDGNHWRSIHDNINDGMGCCYNPQDYVKLLKRTDKRDVFWDDAYQTNALLYHQSKYEDIRNNGPEDNVHYLGVYKGLEYEQQYTQTTHKVISIYIDDSETGFPREANLYVDTAIPNANLLRFQTYTSIIHGAKGIWFWGLLWSATPDEQRYWRSNSVERFNRDHFPKIYNNYVSPLARELRFLVEKNVLNTDPRTIIATKTDRKDPLGIIPPIFSYDSISWSAYLSVPRRRIEHFREYYGLRYTIRTNGEETYMIITNPLNCPVQVTLDFNTIPSGNPFLKYLDQMELMFEDSLPSLTDVASSTYKTNDTNDTNDTLFNVDWLAGTVRKKAPIEFSNPDNRMAVLAFGPLDVKVLKLIPRKGVAQDLDLCIRDIQEDNGTEPSNSGDYPYLSPDIWIRNQDDDLMEHQNAEYDSNNPVYVYVRVSNNSFKTSTDQDSVRLYWCFGGTVHAWPHVWNGDGTANIAGNEVTLGGFVSAEPLPVLKPGQSAVVKFKWMAPDPSKFSTEEFSDGIPQGHFCLIANVVSADDPTQIYDNTHEFVVNNNNVGWKNVTVVDVKPDMPKRISLHWIYSSEQNSVSARLVLQDCTKDHGNPVSGEAEVILHTNEALGDLIESRGSNMNGFKKHDKNQWIIPGGISQASVEIPLSSNDIYMAGVEFRFLTEEVTEPKEYSYFIYTEDLDKGRVLGGTEMKIRRQEKSLFTAKAGNNRTVLQGDSIVLSAQSIGEEANYAWRDIANDTLIFGQEVTLTPSSSGVYSLSVSTPDGYIDYDTVSVSVKDNYIRTVSPNPAHHEVVVAYHVQSGSYASLQVLDASGNLVANYPLSVDQTEITLTVANWTPGSYRFVLLVSNVQSDMKTLIVQ